MGGDLERKKGYISRMATMAVRVNEEEAVIRAKIAEISLPKGVRFIRIELSQMWDGDPAWKMYFSVSKSIPLTKGRIEEIFIMKKAVQRKVFEMETDKFPLVHFLDAR